MSVFRVKKTKDYTVLSNYHIKDKNLSLKAKGLLTVLLSLPENWDYSINGLVAISKEGRDGITSAIKELESKGYLKRTQEKDKDGRFKGYNYDVFEKPFAENPSTGSTMTENPIQLNTKESNTKILNTKESTYTACFETFWDSYPRKKEKAKAYKCYQARLKEGYSEQEMLTACKNYAEECTKNKTEERYIKLCATFLGCNTPFVDYLKKEQKNDTTRKADEDKGYIQRFIEAGGRVEFDGF